MGQDVGVGARPLLIAIVGMTAPIWAAAVAPSRAQSVEDLQGMSIAQLAEIDVSSVSKVDQPLSDAAAAIYVITHDEIVRSGAMTVPDMLRLAPNLQVYQQSPTGFV